MRHTTKGTSANPQNMRRRRYNKWLDSAAEVLEEIDEARTAAWLIENLPDNRHTPKSTTAASQKLRKDKRFGRYEGYTTDILGHAYKTFFYFYEGDVQ